MFTKFQPQVLSILRIISAFVFALHGWQKAFGWFGGLPPNLPANVHTLLITAGWIETIGGVFLLLGLFTSPVAFIMSGEMAAAYFIGHVARAGSILPIVNMGDPAVLLCFIFLFLMTAGGGAWSLDRVLGRDRK
jgi:putative oxidoreductase